ncbi:MAG TPA: histidine--tRNA ligase [Candidatus Saccharimonadales bacterium]|nr:histidine--tRNA ligase [Candidatus Saccharimonadales bacterium]
MALPTQPYKGARDFYPADKRAQKYMFNTMRSVVERYGYEEYDAPIIEPLELYLSKSSEEIVTEQTYSFEDRGGRKVTIRPEMTPTVSRMVAAKRQELAYPLRWYSIPNLWRYERPQRGRLREHWQLNVDIFGVEALTAEMEIIFVADAIMKAYGATPDMYAIRLNSRKLINAILHDYVSEDVDKVLPVIRLIDHKAKMPHDEFFAALSKLVDSEKAKELHELLSVQSFDDLPEKYGKHASVQELMELKKLLAVGGVTNIVDDLSLMRGFDYYTDIVFEVFDTNPENNRSMFGGGRYDGLVGLFGAESVASVGFGMGDVTLQDFLDVHSLLPASRSETDAYIALVDGLSPGVQKAASDLRKMSLNVAVDLSGRSIDKQIKTAVKKGINYVIFIGAKELADEQFTLKNLETGKEEKTDLKSIATILKDSRQQ